MRRFPWNLHPTEVLAEYNERRRIRARRERVSRMGRIPVVNRSECVRCGACVDTAPGVFRLAADGKSEAYDPRGGTEEEIQRAIDRCPVECIRWEGSP